jgi:Mg2+/Co2+ transporter CorC
MRPAVFVPDSKPLDALLREMQRDRNHMALLVDEYGAIAGLATIEDVLEELDGDTVGGLLALELGRVPLPGAEVMWDGLRLRAEGGPDPRGRVRIGTVLVSPTEPEEPHE